MKLMISCLVSLALVTTSCAHKPSAKFDEAISQGHCEDALKQVEGMREDLRYTGPINRTAGQAWSYTATGAGYGADVVLTLVGGTVIFVALCGPMMAAMIAGGAGGNVNCIPADLKNVAYPRNGRDTFKATEELRCPDLTALARAMRKVASCQESRGGKENLKAANTTLRSMTANREFMNCIVVNERQAIETDAYRMDLELEPNK